MPLEEILALLDFGNFVVTLTIVGLTWACAQGLGLVTIRLANALPARRLAVEQLSALLRFGLYVGGIALALRAMFSFSDDVLKLMGGTIVVTTGLVLKDQASSILAGVLILIEKPFQVGDRVNFGGHYGEVTSIGLRAVRLVTLDDNEVTVPNSKFLSEAVASGNSGALHMLVQQDFYIGLDQDVSRAKAIVAECLTTSRYFLPDEPSAVLICQVRLGDTVAARLRAKAYVVELRYEKLFESDVAERVMKAFHDEQIAPPAVLSRNSGSMALRRSHAA